ncbi:RNA polymerase sigma factor [Bacillus sp. PS06]|uniref:RNA polymerase sigma factor n=1 Tax=Bacillus sp. PS06 TaxID=2764176 RepID=UPI00177BDE64|nr:RNA polymerase sigma factor [Bacillus sp. PS06]MBD8070539.1 RNA polymerase sigma factor [Bacillus sp. PS06]
MDPQLIEKWFYSYSDDIYSYLVYYTGSKDVEDLVQEVFLKAIHSIHQFEAKAHPKTWLISIARNLVIDRLRKRKLLNLISINMLFNKEAVIQTGEMPEAILLTNETLSEIYREISSLKNSYKEVLILRLVLEYSVDQSATILGWSNAKVSLTYHRALTALKKRLNRTNDKGGNNIEKTSL